MIFVSRFVFNVSNFEFRVSSSALIVSCSKRDYSEKPDSIRKPENPKPETPILVTIVIRFFNFIPGPYNSGKF
jgi:hypothetical protein